MNEASYDSLSFLCADAAIRHQGENVHLNFSKETDTAYDLKCLHRMLQLYGIYSPAERNLQLS